MRRRKKRAIWKIGSAVIAMALVVALVVSLLPYKSALAAEYTADLDTTMSYTESLGDNASTEYAGRIWTDKTVYSDDSVTITAYGGAEHTVSKGENDFLVSFSALATSESISGQTQAPVDVVFIIDISGSMSNASSGMDNGYSRIYNAVQALNTSIDTVLSLNENTRVGVVAFSSTATTLLPLDRYSKVTEPERECSRWA